MVKLHEIALNFRVIIGVGTAHSAAELLCDVNDWLSEYPLNETYFLYRILFLTFSGTEV